MNDPEAYVRYHRLQYRDNMRCLTENIGRFQWRGTNGNHVGLGSEDVTLDGKAMKILDDSGQLKVSNGTGTLIDISQRRKAVRVLDVGSGDGRFTSDELRRALPANCQIVGCDKSPAMVDFANTHHAGDGVTFELVEIGKAIPDHYIGAFDHIFSFFCYHWIPNQKAAFSQTYDMLRPGGDCLLLLVAHFPIVFDVYRSLSRSSRWGKWVHHLDDLISPYHDCEDPEMKLRKYAEEAGFKDVYVKNTKSTYTYASVRDVKNMMTALNPFQIPEELMGEYMEDFIRVSREEGYLSDTLTITYSTNTMYARKY